MLISKTPKHLRSAFAFMKINLLCRHCGPHSARESCWDSGGAVISRRCRKVSPWSLSDIRVLGLFCGLRDQTLFVFLHNRSSEKKSMCSAPLSFLNLFGHLLPIWNALPGQAARTTPAAS